MRMIACGRCGPFRYRAWVKFDNRFVQLAFLDDGAAICRHDVADITPERVDPGFRLGREDIDIELLGWHGENGDVVRSLFALKVVEGGVEGLGSCEIESCVFLRRIKLLDLELPEKLRLESLRIRLEICRAGR